MPERAGTWPARGDGVMTPVQWGVIGPGMIAMERVIPAMRGSAVCTVAAVASRDQGRAEAAAARAGIPRAYGSYEALLADPAIEVIYNALPNHLHLEWTARAAEAGKHVLCEKPIGMNAAEADAMIAVRDRTGVLIEEAFMVRNHPQWPVVRGLLRSGRIGRIDAVQAAFTYVNLNPGDIRNQPAVGGGAIYDLGCYATAMTRYIFEREPVRALAIQVRDPVFGTDRLATAVLDFGDAQATWTVTTQSARYQGLVILGSEGWIRPEIPFSAFPTNACRIHVAGDVWPGPFPEETIEVPPANHYTRQAERFSRLVRGEEAEVWPLEDARANMAVLDALFRSVSSSGWENV